MALERRTSGESLNEKESQSNQNIFQSDLTDTSHNYERLNLRKRSPIIESKGVPQESLKTQGLDSLPERPSSKVFYLLLDTENPSPEPVYKHRPLRPFRNNNTLKNTTNTNNSF